MTPDLAAALDFAEAVAVSTLPLAPRVSRPASSAPDGGAGPREDS